MLHPQDALTYMTRLYPDRNPLIEQRYFNKSATYPDCHDSVFLPLVAWYGIVSQGRQLTVDKISDVGNCSAVMTWQYSKSIYEFDEDIYESLTTAGISGNIPLEIFYQMPEWCVYIKTPHLKLNDLPILGFFAHLEQDSKSNQMELRFVLHFHDHLFPIPLLLNGGDIEGAINHLINQLGLPFAIPIPNDDRRDIIELLKKLVPLVLYLCTDQPEYNHTEIKPQNTRPSKTKRGLRLFPVDKVRTWKVGVDIGDVIRQARTQCGGKKSAHLRRAHWQHYWTGSAAVDNRKVICKFKRAIFVGEKDEPVLLVA